MRIFFLLYPWLELLSLIQLGIETNALTALVWVVTMFLLGGAMIRRVGMSSVTRLREAQRTGILQQHLLVDDMAVVVAGLLLIIPGLLSDFFAVVVLIGPLRRALARWLALTMHTPVSPVSPGSRSPDQRRYRSEATRSVHRCVTLEGEYRQVDDPELSDDTSSAN